MAGDNNSKVDVSAEWDLRSHIVKKVKQYVHQHQYETALFWADKAASLSHGDIEEVYWIAQCLYLTGQYHRAVHAIKSRKFDKKDIACRYLASKCHFECKEYQEALDVLDMIDFTAKTPNKHKKEESMVSEFDHGIPQSQLKGSMCLLRGKVYEAMNNRALAAESYKEALQVDVYCCEAFDLLVRHNMLTAKEEQALLESLPFEQQCQEGDLDLLKFLYRNKLNKFDKPNAPSQQPGVDALHDNLDVVTNLAERHYYNCDFRTCYKITSEVLNVDPYHTQCLPIHIAALIELKKSNALFYLAHKLVDMYPNQAVAWYAVGCYYLLIGKFELARRYFSKSATLDRNYGPAWLAFGHAFAAEGEHDQATAAYFSASQIMRGCHLPMLYIGLEYGLTNNPKLAEKFFKQALSIAPEDPFVLHEMGVVAYHNHDWKTAFRYFSDALRIVQVIGSEIMTEKWEPLLNNLGHVCRKMGNYDEALEYHQQALVLCPQNPSTYSAIGFIHSLKLNFAQAVDYFHKALGVKRDDTISVTMLADTIVLYIDDIEPCEGGDIAEMEATFDITKATTTTSKDESRDDITSGPDSTIEEVEMED
ncbi:cell division cycle protein 16 homolog [Ptychodera flava]|uniref:cell division cycle protein 16 homolog n=1 Tax=Ptychodera flava TaxID=63121 RepID=UPI00396A985C